jgi:GT2 family glycosyltransferase
LASLGVVIPAYNSARQLESCLRALSKSAAKPAEIVVVDDCSSDSTADVAFCYGVTLIQSAKRRGPAAARNLGARAVHGEILVFLDADVEVHPDTLRRIQAAFAADPGLAAIMGSYDDDPADPGLVSRYRNLLHCHTHWMGRPDSTSFWAGCGSIRRQAFLEAGGFDESFPDPSIEDIEFGWRLSQAGQKLGLDPSIQVRHLKRWTLPLMLSTDLWARAVPWTKLLLETGRMPDDLILRHNHRMSVLLAWMVPLAGAGAFLNPTGGAAVLLLLLAGYTWFNRGFLAFLLSRSKGSMAVVGLPLHLLFHLTAGLGFSIGVVAHLLGKVTQRDLAMPRKVDE